MGKKQRRIGQVLERKVAHILSPAFPDSKVARGLQFRDATMCDVEGTPFRIECKRRERPSDLSYNAIQKFLERNTEDGEKYDDPRIPLLIAKLKGRSPITVHLLLSDFVSLVERHFWRPGDDEPEIVGLDD